MDFGVMALEGLMGPEGGATGAAHSLASDPETKPKGHAPNVPHGSGSVKQQRSWPAEDDWRTSKMPKNDDLPAPKTMPLQYQGTPLLRSNSLLPADTHRQEQMLSFSNNKSEVTFLSKDGMLERNIQGPDFAYYQRTPALTPSAYTRNAAGTNFIYVSFLIFNFLYLGGGLVGQCWSWIL